MSGINVTKQSLNTLIIVIGIGLLLYDFIAKPEVIYFKISGLIILMFGLYKSTKQWTADNNTEKDNDLNDSDSGIEDLDVDEKNMNQNGK
jgi:hypothetical protein